MEMEKGALGSPYLLYGALEVALTYGTTSDRKLLLL